MHPLDQLLSDWVDAMRRGDADAIAELVTDDAEFWSPGLAPIRGREATRSMMQSAMKKYKVTRSWIERLTGEDFVVSIGIERTTAVPRECGDPVEITQRGWTMARRCADGRWRFARGITNRES